VNSRVFFGKADLDPFVLDLLGAGMRVFAPVRRRDPVRAYTEYRRIDNSDEIVLDGSQPVRPLKEVVFPPTETLFRWKQTQSLVTIEENPPGFEETVVIGAAPCDAAALEIVDRVMGWDYRDDLWFGRRDATTILTLACTSCDDSCFCTALGLSPESRRGSDWFLTPADGGFEIEVLTQKGEALLARHRKRFTESKGTGRSSSLEPKVRSNLALQRDKIRHWLEGHFEDPLWKDLALRCHGCGACAFVCPACHCFDIIDEPEGADCGSRRRNWDACQTALFTVHGSGHNPRRDQSARFRQRIMHKFNVYPARFGEILCTGCGRCVRVCAAGMDLVAILDEIGRKAEEADTAL
jgi:formate hydrogenlyase subunit 6/NADH:ubiquinone oxidoreductase subunit I